MNEVISADKMTDSEFFQLVLEKIRNHTGEPLAQLTVVEPGRLIGRVSMDMLTVDLTVVPNAQIGSHVELWGQNIPIDEVAQSSGTIGYELMCALATRVPVCVED